MSPLNMTTLTDIVKYLVSRTSGKRKREITHIEGIPVACMIEEQKSEVREVIVSRKGLVAPGKSQVSTVRGRAEKQSGPTEHPVSKQGGLGQADDNDEDEDDDDDDILIIM